VVVTFRHPIGLAGLSGGILFKLATNSAKADADISQNRSNITICKYHIGTLISTRGPLLYIGTQYAAITCRGCFMSPAPVRIRAYTLDWAPASIIIAPMPLYAAHSRPGELESSSAALKGTPYFHCCLFIDQPYSLSSPAHDSFF